MGPAGSFADGFGVARVILHTGTALAVGSDELWWNQTNLVSECTEFAGPVMGGAAGFHRDQAGLEIGGPAQEPASCNRPAGDDALGGIDRVDLDDVLGEVNSDAGDRVHDFLLGARLFSGPMIAPEAC